MNIADKYIQYVKTKTEAEPEKSWDKILFGFKVNCLRTHFLPNKNITKGYQRLEDMMMNMVADALSHKKKLHLGQYFCTLRADSQLRSEHPVHRMSGLLCSRLSPRGLFY